MKNIDKIKQMNAEEMTAHKAYLKWLLPKCKYAVENGSEEYIKERFIQLISYVQGMIAESEVKE